ncbi:hypothetical protein QVD17_36490 [Tagetes erecta]|uniref:Uncharacterized protein n=1 Tax=Tagetes erecta TaxID=13708 RepID=A0AAD8JSJ1_TARER|nr:hypothetical protein QVD17_36490 [Tagetes erecta]
MEDHPNYILDLPYFSKEKSTEQLTESLWLTTMELQEQIKSRDNQLTHLKHLLNNAITERNEAQNKYQSLLQFQFHKTTTPPPNSTVSSIEDEPITHYAFSSSDCEESIVSSPNIENPIQLPEQGKFLEAVMKAGPLLQNLLLAGPLPEWRHPPPPVDTYQIPSPPWLISQESLRDNCYEINKKRGFFEDSVSSTETKYQRICL